MNNSNTSPNIPYTGWQILGSLELPFDTSTDASLQAWLLQVLSPLELHEPLLSKILSSAQDAAGRAMQSQRAAGSRHVHFLVYAAKQPLSNGQTWGFFWVDKIDDPVQEEIGTINHSIELYLYLEG